MNPRIWQVIVDSLSPRRAGSGVGFFSPVAYLDRVVTGGRILVKKGEPHHV